jgi:hypothetical protein
MLGIAAPNGCAWPGLGGKDTAQLRLPHEIRILRAVVPHSVRCCNPLRKRGCRSDQMENASLEDDVGRRGGRSVSRMEFGWETWRPDKQDQMPRPDQASITDNGRGSVEARFSPVVFPSCLTTGPSLRRDAVLCDLAAGSDSAPQVRQLLSPPGSSTGLRIGGSS